MWAGISKEGPPESPDLNPIKKLGAQLKGHLCRQVKPMNQAELVQGIEEFWANKMTPDLCTRYINHIHTVIPKVIDCKGGPPGEYFFVFLFTVLKSLFTVFKSLLIKIYHSIMV